MYLIKICGYELKICVEKYLLMPFLYVMMTFVSPSFDGIDKFVS